MDREYLRENNTEYTRHLAKWAVRRGVRFLYASSAATYGDGSLGFSDDDETTRRLRPLNPYGESKHQFDLWALEHGYLDRIAGFKFFNVFGPNEYQKGPMISGAYRAFQQITATGKVSLFRSNHPEYADGEQRRDFVYVKDCVEVLWWFLCHPAANGLFNVGTGEARTWSDLARAVFAALDLPPRVEYIAAPDNLRATYQYHTQADLTRLRSVGCDVPFRSLEEAVADYVRNHLTRPQPYLHLENES
jgi:ADP-L-glycero-D-manno-heptose 6-epimerase